MREAIGIDPRQPAARDLYHAQVEPFVGEGEVLSVGRPGGRKEEGRVGDRDLARLTESILGSDHELVLAALIGEPGDGLSIGRPDRIAIGCSRRTGEVAPIAFLDRNSEDLAPSLKQRARSRWRERRIAEA